MLQETSSTVIQNARKSSAREMGPLCVQPFIGIVQAYANSKGVKIVGDIPIYVGGQSADVWAYQDLFELGADGQPLIVSGVPPDAFSETGQLWGSPIYDWKVRRSQNSSISHADRQVQSLPVPVPTLCKMISTSLF